MKHNLVAVLDARQVLFPIPINLYLGHQNIIQNVLLSTPYAP